MYASMCTDMCAGMGTDMCTDHLYRHVYGHVAPAMESTPAVVDAIEALKKEFVTAMFLLSASSVDDLHLNDSLVLSER